MGFVKTSECKSLGLVKPPQETKPEDSCLDPVDNKQDIKDTEKSEIKESK